MFHVNLLYQAILEVMIHSLTNIKHFNVPDAT